MINTFNRRPLSVNMPSSNDLKEYYFNHCNFKGIIDNKNILTVEQESFEEATNVYVDEQGLLKSRPSIKYKNTAISNVYDIFVLGKYILYVTNDAELYLTKDDELLIDAIQLDDINCKFNLLQNNILIFSPKSLHIVDLTNFLYLDAASIVYIPELSDPDKQYYDKNELSNVVKTVYQYDSLLENIAFVGNTIYFTLYDKDYSLVVNKEYDLVRLVNIYLDLRHINKDDFEMWSVTTTDSKTNTPKDILLYRYENNLKMYYNGQTINIPYPYLENNKRNMVKFSIFENGTGLLCVYAKDYADGDDELTCLKYMFSANEWLHMNIQQTYFSRLGQMVINNVIARDDTHIAIWGATTKLAGDILWYIANDLVFNHHYYSSSIRILDVVYTDDVIGLITYTNYGDVRPCNLVEINCIEHTVYSTRWIKENIASDTVRARLFKLNNNWYAYFIIYSNSNDVVYHHLRTLPYNSTTDYDEENSELWYAHDLNDDIRYNYPLGGLEIEFTLNRTFNIFIAYITEEHLTYNKYTTHLLQFDVTELQSGTKIKPLHYSSKLYSPLNKNMSITSSDKYYYYTDEAGNVISNNISNTMDLWTINNGGYLNIYPDKIVQDDDKLYLMKDNELYISEPTLIGDKFWLYFPQRNTETFDEDITNIHKISNDELAIFFENYVIIAKRGIVTLGNKDYNGYYYSKSKLPIGCKKYSDIITSFDGAHTIVPTKRGLAYLSYQQFVASQEQVVSYISDTIYSIWYEFAKDPIKLYKNSYYVYCYKEISNECLLLDVRTNGWYIWVFPVNTNKMLNLYNEHIIFNDGIYTFSKTENEYYDNCKSLGKTNVNWSIKSQKLHFNAPNNYKHLNSLTMTSVLDSDRPLCFNLQLTNYRDNVDKSRMETVEYTVDTVKTFVQRLNFGKVIEFQYYLQNCNEYEIQTPLNISNISIKYKIGGQVR